MGDWVEDKLRKKLRRRYVRLAAAVIRLTLRLRAALGLGRGRGVVNSRYGVRMHANWQDRTFQYCYFGTYGRFLADYIAGYDSAFSFLDIGANQGLYSLLAARNPHCGVAVALEPVPATFDLLEANVAANGVAGKVRCIRAALADRRGEAHISMRAHHSGTATLVRDAGFDNAQKQPIELIDIAGLDELLPASGSLVAKVDVEGYEHVVLAELVRSRHVQRIAAVFYEVDDRWSSASQLQSLLEGAGYKWFTRHGRGKHYDVLATRAPVRLA